MKIVFASYNNQPGYSNVRDWIKKIHNQVALMEALAQHAEVYYIKYGGCDEERTVNNVRYIMFQSDKHRYRFPKRMHKKLKAIQPDVVIVSGLKYPLQIIQLRSRLGKKVVILGRHHADQPPTGFRRMLQRWADKRLNGYLFTSNGNADGWIESGIIKEKE